jgi:hypothetical protein
MPARNSDGTIRNGRAPAKLTMRSVVARWVEAETIRRKQMGLSWDMIAEQITQVGRGLAQPLVSFPAGIRFAPDYSITYRGVAKAFNNGFRRMPNLEVEQMRRLDTERCEDIYRGLVPGIMRGEPPAGTTAVRALEHKARINGYAAEPDQTGGVGSFQINIHVGGEASESKPAIDLRRPRAIGRAQ